MKRLISQILATPLCLAAIYCQADTQTLSIDGYSSSSNFNFPGLEFSGPVKGQLKLKRTSPNDIPASSSEFDIERLSLDFEFAPDINISGFKFNQYSGTYIAQVNNLWVFKTVNVEITHITPDLQNFDYRISVETIKDLTGNMFPSPFISDAILTEGNGLLINETPFKLVDIANAQAEGKRVNLKLNGHLGSNFNPEEGMTGEGIELKVLWFGRGEKLVYIPKPSDTAKPVGIILNPLNIGGTTEYHVAIRYEDNGIVNETGHEPLEQLLTDAFPPL